MEPYKELYLMVISLKFSLKLIMQVWFYLEVLQKANEKGNCSLHGDANNVCDILTSWVFFSHLVGDILAITHDLCNDLKCKNPNILNAMSLVSTAKSLLQRMKESDWERFFKEVISFCEKHEINVLDMIILYAPRRGWAHHNVDHITI